MDRPLRPGRPAEDPSARPQPPKPKPFLPGTPQFAELPNEVQERVEKYSEAWQKKYFGELATPSEYPLSFNWYTMRVGQLVQEYIRQGRARVEVYMSYVYGASYGYPEAKVAREVLLDESLVPFHVGHWEHGSVGKGGDVDVGEDTDLPNRIWWAKSRGGVHINDALPINPSPLVGGQN